MQQYRNEARSIPAERKPPGRPAKHKKPYGIREEHILKIRFAGGQRIYDWSHTVWYRTERDREQALAQALEKDPKRKRWLVER